MTLELRLTHAFPGFKLDLAFDRAAGLTCAVRAVGVGQDHDGERGGGAVAA
jgi:hypothetical protein